MIYQLLKQGVPVAIAHSAEECDDIYLKYDCDEVREIEMEDDNENPK